ncbi:MAG: radical SAM protein [Promethearchaeota archaeon]
MELKTFELKVELLFKGIKLVDKLSFEPGDATIGSKPSSVDKIARKGGAGPAGGFYARYRDEFIVNIPAQQKMVKNSNLVAETPKDGTEFSIYLDEGEGAGKLDEYARLFKIPRPSFYDDDYYPKERNEIGKPVKFRQIALIHGEDCIASTINQTCLYWRNGSQCIFCAIEESIKNGVLVKKSPDALVAFTERAREERRVSHYTLTSGTQEGPDGGALEYIPIVEALKENFSYPVHVQIAPVNNLEYIDKLYYSGVDNIGIHIETYPDRLRKVVCPGKSLIPIKNFEKNWDYAVKTFGPNNVESYLLVGFGESFEEFKKAVDLMVDHEVIPFIVPARPIENTRFQENLISDYKVLVNYYKYAGKRLHEQGLNPSKSNSGCVKCGGCSAISEATMVAQKFN